MKNKTRIALEQILATIEHATIRHDGKYIDRSSYIMGFRCAERMMRAQRDESQRAYKDRGRLIAKPGDSRFKEDRARDEFSAKHGAPGDFYSTAAARRLKKDSTG